MPELNTLAFLLIAGANIGIIVLYRRLCARVDQLDDGQLDRLILHRLSEAARRQRDTKQLIRDEHLLTRRRIAEVKTRLADEERQDQREKAQARYQARKGTND